MNEKTHDVSLTTLVGQLTLSGKTGILALNISVGLSGALRDDFYTSFTVRAWPLK